MKIRIRGNSLRLRLTKSEVEQFAKDGKVDSSIRFGINTNEKLSYAIVASGKIHEVRANLSDGHISVFVPESIAEEWTQTDQTGFNVSQFLAPDSPLEILIEKDFACLNESVDQDQSNKYTRTKKAGAC